jgi:hypothetical protein
VAQALATVRAAVLPTATGKRRAGTASGRIVARIALGALGTGRGHDGLEAVFGVIQVELVVHGDLLAIAWGGGLVVGVLSIELGRIHLMM